MKSKPSAHVAANSYEINMFNMCKKRIVTDGRIITLVSKEW